MIYNEFSLSQDLARARLYSHTTLWVEAAQGK